ncbi:MAG: haloacid dehalogenase-like hydrolase [Caudoviricetes sp.]|nr:MAG: haloacid dehalogenase-like hydrolase [Caudoviricetes sp.]
MQYKKRILTDIDHVVLHHATSFQKWLSKNYCSSFENKSWADYPNFEEWLGLNTEKANEIIYDFNTSEYFSDLFPEKDSLIFVNQLHALGYEFIGITACGDNELIQKYREVNLNHWFPNIFRKVFYVNDPREKLQILENFEPSYWVEDSASNALLGVQCNHKTYLMEQPYNSHIILDNVKNVKSWKNIYEDIVS